MRNVYSRYWLEAREKRYGFMRYDVELCEFLTGATKAGSPLLEVAIGTGFPIADFLQKAGHRVHGIDISPALIQRCREVNPAIEAKVGNAESLDYPDDTFGATYSFHSSWYFSDLARVVNEMLRVTRPGGLIMFDIQNRNNSAIAADFERRCALVRPGLICRTRLHARNLAKVLLRRGNPNWYALNYEVPTYPETVYENLDGLNFSVLGRREEDQALIALEDQEPFSAYQRLVFAIHK